jgi:hypothetical protein
MAGGEPRFLVRTKEPVMIAQVLVTDPFPPAFFHETQWRHVQATDERCCEQRMFTVLFAPLRLYGLYSGTLSRPIGFWSDFFLLAPCERDVNYGC